MTLPKAFSQDFLYKLILLEYGEMEPLYKNTVDFELSVSMFWQKNTPVFDKLAETTDLDYDPLEDQNYKSNRKEYGKNKKVQDGQQLTDNGGTESGTSDRKDYVSAFNQGNGESLKDHSNSEDSRQWDSAGKQDWTRNLNGEWGTEVQYTNNGLKNNTYQKLIEQQRKVVNYHVEDLILKMWAQELMVAIW